MTDPLALAPVHLEPAAVVGVVGAGTMGAGIAQLALAAGHRVLLHDVDPAALERARGRVAEGLARQARRRGLTDDAAAVEARLALARLEAAPDLEALGRGADIVIEAVLEDVALKQAVFARLDAAAPPSTILATNTSALPVGAMAAAARRHPERVLGLHFFNPAPVMPLVEVVATREADPAVVAAAVDLMVAWGRTPVRSADAPGFIVNRVNRSFTLEALRILEAGGGTVEGIDAALRADGFPMGPFELIDLIGVDVNLAAAREIFEAFGHAPRFRPSPVQGRLVAAGRLGRKTGEGFYRYGGDGRAIGPAEAFAAEPAPTAEPTRGAEPLPAVQPTRGAALPALDAVVERIVLGIVNEAYLALGEGVASTAADIDLALRLGAGHPRGPFEQVERLGGPARVVARLERLRALDGERFEPAPLLRELTPGR